jgi:hypothetical protein
VSLPAAGSPASSASSSPARSVFLVNGDQLGADSASAGQCLGVVSDGPRDTAGQIRLLRVGGTSYALPAAALPYLGRGLEPSLFDVNGLATAESGGRLPVTVHYTGGLPSLPGVTITKSGQGTAQGYLTQAGAVRFGHALAQQSAGRNGQTGMFASGVSLGLAGTTAQAPARSTDAKDEVTVTGTDIAGQPAGDEDGVFLFNADNSATFDNPSTSIESFSDGVAKFSVPPGNYWAVGDFYRNLPNERSYKEYLDVLPQFQVSKDMTVHVAAAEATSKIQASVPRHVVAQDTIFQLVRSAAAGPAVSLAWSEGNGGPSSPEPSLYVSPTSASPAVGKLATVTALQLGSRAYPAYSQYLYGLAYQSSGTIPAQDHVVNQASLAALDLRFYSDIGAWGDLSELPQFTVDNDVCGLGFVMFWGMHSPQQKKIYLSTAPGLSWATQYIQTGPSRGMTGGQFGPPLAYAPGEQQTQDFGAYPLHPAPDARVENIAGLAPTLVSAGRAGNTLRLAMTAFSDSIPGHFGQGTGAPVKTSASYQIDQNGTQIASGSLPNFYGPVAASAALSPSPSTIQFTLNTAQSTAMGPLSTATQTVWAWRSAPAAGATLPAGWTCLPGGVVNRACAVQPMMTLRYAVAGMNLSGATVAGQQVVHIQAGHLQLARQAAITGAQVSVSFDGGKTWQPAKVTGSGSSYDAVFDAPAGAKVTLRTSATDAAGGSVTETITNAFEVAAS